MLPKKPPATEIESITDLERAVDLRLKALEIDELLGNAVGAIDNCIHLSELYTLKGDPLLAEQSFRHALRASGILSADIQTGRIVFLLGAICWARGEVDQGAALFRKAVDIFAGFQCEALLSKSCHALACVYRSQGRFEEAEGLLQRSLDIANRLNDPMALADALCAMGTFYLHEGRADPSLRWLHQAFALYKGSTNDIGRADCLGHLGLAYLFADQLEKAKAYLIQARQLNITIQRPGRQADNAANLANACRYQGQTSEACRYYLESLAIYEVDGRSHKAGKIRDLLRTIKGSAHRQRTTGNLDQGRDPSRRAS